ncbi:APC family permease [Mammaliicoccus sp. Dog046]|uniref:APC family permease n=1 Tax=Mammaliicoccus sp. Dog046 TaxID=3034233 RepID=UPI002B262416|nr:APC family permease [Mammaliicoccus sp. Dog046]WQK86724.1 APC family permease [Mammaliicoccus sp. Dog046]
MFSQAKRLLIGKPKKNKELQNEKISNKKALAILSSDALSSVAYGPEQILIVLSVLGAVAAWYTLPLTLFILILLITLVLSYRQVIYAYPQGGGAYTVSKFNLGEKWSLLAGGSLLVDYILTVAVSISSGTDAFIAAFPNLYDQRILIACSLVIVILILNLRGLTESATVLSYPVYLFIFGLIALILVGIWKVATGQVEPQQTSAIGTSVPGVTIFLLLKAFSSGASSLTGIEAISNAVNNFKDPAPKNAVKTLVMMGSILTFMLIGMVTLTYYYGIMPQTETTVLSQLAKQIFGDNIAFYFIQGVTVLILVLAANTGFTAFPLLAANMAKDKYMPHMFTVRGDRLGYSNSIIILAVFAILLIIGFNGKTENLVPLYAVGVFIPFTLAQLGMMLKWIRERPTHWRKKLFINTLGTVLSFTVFSILLITKLGHVWPILVFLPIVVFIFIAIRKHYITIAKQLNVDNIENEPVVKSKNLAIIPISSITKAVDKSISYAKITADDIIVVHVAVGDTNVQQLQKKWKTLYPEIRLVVIHSEYRNVIKTITRFIDKINHKPAYKDYLLTVIIPQFITNKRWHNLLHNQTSFMLKVHLFYRKNIVLSTIPYKLKR